MKQISIIGAGFAALSAARELRELDADADADADADMNRMEAF
jgi:NADPH-dependent 2,4-dienoyl-CoA reductase/sulfur reductase-like enzyme